MYKDKPHNGLTSSKALMKVRLRLSIFIWAFVSFYFLKDFLQVLLCFSNWCILNLTKQDTPLILENIMWLFYHYKIAMFGYWEILKNTEKKKNVNQPLFSPFRSNHCPCFGGTSSPGVLNLGFVGEERSFIFSFINLQLKFNISFGYECR